MKDNCLSENAAQSETVLQKVLDQFLVCEVETYGGFEWYQIDPKWVWLIYFNASIENEREIDQVILYLWARYSNMFTNLSFIFIFWLPWGKKRVKVNIFCVFRRYAGDHYDTQTRKARNPTEEWFENTLKPFNRKAKRSIDLDEDNQLQNIAAKAPFPTSIGLFKSHPLYALTRHLLKFEAIYPPDAPPLGYIRKEPIYARECVHELNGRVAWMKEGQIVKIGQEPYKVNPRRNSLFSHKAIFAILMFYLSF